MLVSTVPVSTIELVMSVPEASTAVAPGSVKRLPCRTAIAAAPFSVTFGAFGFALELVAPAEPLVDDPLPVPLSPVPLVPIPAPLPLSAPAELSPLTDVFELLVFVELELPPRKFVSQLNGLPAVSGVEVAICPCVCTIK